MDNKILLGIVGLIVGVYGWLLKHLSNQEKHLSSGELARLKESVQWKDVCDEKSKRIEDCIEVEIKALQGKLDDQKENINTRFDRVEQLIRNNHS